MEEFGILSLIPPIVAIILALTTKDVIISLVSSVAAGALVLAHFNPHGAFVIFWKDLFFTELTVNSWNGEWTFSGICRFVTDLAVGRTSLAQTGRIP